MSEMEDLVFWGPITAKELEIRWRLKMAEKSKDVELGSPDEDNLDASNIPLPDDSFVSVESDTCSNTSYNRIENGGVKHDNLSVDGGSQNSSNMILTPSKDENEERKMKDNIKETLYKEENITKTLYKEDTQIETKENIDPSPKPKSMIPVRGKFSVENTIVKPAKLNFNKEATATTWDFKMKKITSRRPQYMISPAKIGLFAKSKSKSTIGGSNLIELSQSSRSVETIHSLPVTKESGIRTPSKSKLYSYVQSPVARYIRNEAIVQDTNKILPKSNYRRFIDLSKEPRLFYNW